MVQKLDIAILFSYLCIKMYNYAKTYASKTTS